MKQRKPSKIETRRRAREIALQVWYSINIRNISDGADLIFEEFILNLETAEEESSISYARELISGISEKQSELDALIRENVIGWRPERMSTTDKAAIHIALFEGLISKKVDLPVAISEAIELAKLFGSDESVRFVHGVLGKIVSCVTNKE